MRIETIFFKCVVALLFLVATPLYGQLEEQKEEPVSKKKSEKISKKPQVSSSAKEVVKSLELNDEEAIAKNYEVLAQKFIDKEELTKGEEYLKKAVASYTKLKRPDDIARVSRTLAKVQEKQNKTMEAISNYEKASYNISNSSEQEMKINNLDAGRLKNSNNKDVQYDIINSNIELLQKEENKTEELKDAFVQKAEINKDKNDYKAAIESYNQAIEYSKDKPEAVLKLKNEIAEVYTSTNQFDKAIAIHKNLLTEAIKSNNINHQISQLQNLASIYFQLKNTDLAISNLKKAYQLALQKGNTKAVKESLSSLLNYYKSIGNTKESITLYEEFFRKFEHLIHSDSTLIDINTFQVIEGKIKQLEKEKKLKDRLISKTNTFNYFLIGSLVILLLLIGLIIKTLFSIQTKNKKIALQSLRREMNPHFIFNSLNSVNQFISQNKELEANKYLTSYSNLMRNMMENSSKDFILLGNEIELMQKYLDLEHMRFADKFDFSISVDDNLDVESTFVPNMLIQPNLENAIWHGLRYLDGKGFLSLTFSMENNQIIVLIEDNGIGITKSNELKTQNQKIHESLGLKNTQARIELLNDLYKKHISFQLIEKQYPETGTIVKIEFPIIDKI